MKLSDQVITDKINSYPWTQWAVTEYINRLRDIVIKYSDEISTLDMMELAEIMWWIYSLSKSNQSDTE